MSYSYSIFISTASAPAFEVSGELRDQDVTVLESYLSFVEALNASKPIRDSLPCDFRFTVDADLSGGSLEATLPDADSIAVVLHRLRPLILQKEETSFVNVAAVLGRTVVEPRVRAAIREQRELFQNSDRAQTWAVSANGVRINSEEVLQDWLNGFEYHTDAERRDRFNNLLEGPEVLVRYSVIRLLLNKIDAINGLAGLVRVILGRVSAVNIGKGMPGQIEPLTIRASQHTRPNRDNAP